jgi:hypothetical protein
MTDLNQNFDQAKDALNLEDKDMKKLPQMLNVLTILTYIGSGCAFIYAIWTYVSIGASYKVIEGYKSMTEGLSGSESKAVQSIMSGSIDLVKKQYDNRLFLLLGSLIGAALCFYGAMQMRNLKKQGFPVYVVGELLPTLAFAIFVGFGNIFSGFAVIFWLLVAIVFIVLYATQRKNLVN